MHLQSEHGQVNYRFFLELYIQTELLFRMPFMQAPHLHSPIDVGSENPPAKMSTEEDFVARMRVAATWTGNCNAL